MNNTPIINGANHEKELAVRDMNDYFDVEFSKK
jgi:hypothetical protein